MAKEYSLEELADWFKQVANTIPLKQAKAMNMAALLTKGELQKSVRKNLNKGSFKRTKAMGYVAGAQGSAGLAGSFRPVFFGVAKGELKAGVYSGLPYAEVHETGKPVIKAKDKLMTIPFTKDARQYGAREFPAPLFFGYHPFSTKHATIVGFLFQETGNSNKPLIAQYALASRVKLDATHYISKARDTAKPVIEKLLEEATLDVLLKDFE